MCPITTPTWKLSEPEGFESTLPISIFNLSAVDIDGYYNLSQKIDRKDLLVIYIDTKDGIREGRAKVRGSFSQTEWDRRLKDDNLKFTTTEMENISEIKD